MRNVRLPAAAVSVFIVALAAQAALAQGAPPPPPPGPAPSGSAVPAPPPTTTAPAMPPPAGSVPVAPAPTDSAAPPAPPPPAPPASAAAPVAPAIAAPQPTAPVAAPSTAPAEPGEDKPAQKTKPPASTLAIEAMLGVGGRLDSTTSGYSDDQRGGLLFGGGLFFSPMRMLAVGLSYQRQVGAFEQYEPGPTLASGKISRTYQSLLANVRVYPIRNDTVGLWGGLLIGATFQTARSTGTDIPPGVYASPKSYTVDAGPSAGMALGLGVGVDYDVSNAIGFLASANLLNSWLKSDSLTSAPDRPVPGAGSMTVLDLRVAFQYRFDTSGAAIPASGTVHTSKR